MPSLASALTSTGAAAGIFAGYSREARIWELSADGRNRRRWQKMEITSRQVSRPWGLNEGGSGQSRTTARDITFNGTLVNGTGVDQWLQHQFGIAPVLTRRSLSQLGSPPTSTFVRWRTDIARLAGFAIGSAVGSSIRAWMKPLRRRKTSSP